MKNKEQIILVLSIIGCFALGLYFGILATQKEYERRALKVSFPEEFKTVRKGDTIYVDKVTDSIYLGFRKYK